MHLSVVIPEGGSILPGDICGHGPLDLLTFGANCLAQDGGLDCFCRIPEETTPRICLMHLAELAGKENNERSIENVVLSHSLIYKESSTSSHAVDKCRLRPDFELFLRQTKL